MAMERQTEREFTHVRIRSDKHARTEKLVRKVAYIEDRNVTQQDLIDEILEEGLTKRERKLGI
jgi:hypothetical protein